MLIDLLRAQASAICSTTCARLSSVSLAAPIDAPPSAQPLLNITYNSCAKSAPERAGDGVTLSASLPTTITRLAVPTVTVEDLDAQFLSLAWEVGAWDVSRMEHMPLTGGADPMDPAQGLLHHVMEPYSLPGTQAEEPPCNPVLWVCAAAETGWLVWSCKPMWLAAPVRQKAWISKDKTLLPDGSRVPRAQPWTPWHPVWIGSNHQTVIRLGRAPHGNRSSRR